METVPMDVDSLNDNGASLMLENLYGMPENCISNWSSMGPLLERHKVTTQFLEEGGDWHASLDVDGEAQFSTAKNPRLAVARVLVKKVLVENPENSYDLSLTLKRAFEIGLSREGVFMEVLLRISGGTIDEQEKVLVQLKVYD